MKTTTLLDKINDLNEQDEQQAREEMAQTADNSSVEIGQQSTQKFVNKSARTNPIMDERLTDYIDSNQELYDYYSQFSKQDLIRKLMMKRMKQENFKTRYEQAHQWLNKNPQIKEDIMQEVRMLPWNKQQAALIEKTEARAKEIAYQSANNVNRGVVAAV